MRRLAAVDAHEGPVVVDGWLCFTTTPREPGMSAIRRIPVAGGPAVTVRADGNAANGMALDARGRLVVCEQGTMERRAAIAAVDPFTGEREVLTDAWNGLPFNSPNDVAVRSDGTIWFTDPSYGHLQGFRPPPETGEHVYRFDPASRRTHLVADGFAKPNGLTFSADESVLFVGDNGAGVLYAIDLATGHRTAIATFEGEHPDGLKLGPDGLLYASSVHGIDVLTPDGARAGRIPLPGAVNFCWHGDRLFITADTAIWAYERSSTAMPAVRRRRTIDEAGAEAVLGVAEAHALAHGLRVSIAVVDPSGEVIAQRRTPGTQVASSRVAVDKARTAAIFIRPSRELEQQVTDGRLGALALHGAHALIGGIPLRVDGEVVGAVGASGETTEADEGVALAGAAAAFSTAEVFEITQAGARRVADAVGEAAAERGVSPVVSVVDSGGELVYLHRPDAAQVASVGVTTDKARTAAIYRRPSKDFEDQASNGRPSALHLARAVPLQGGMPLEWDGQVVGAVGVSGASSAPEDQELATIGTEALRTEAVAT